MSTSSDRARLQQIQKQFAEIGWLHREDVLWLIDTLAQVYQPEKQPNVESLLEYLKTAPDWIPDGDED